MLHLDCRVMYEVQRCTPYTCAGNIGCIRYTSRTLNEPLKVTARLIQTAVRGGALAAGMPTGLLGSISSIPRSEASRNFRMPKQLD